MNHLKIKYKITFTSFPAHRDLRCSSAAIYIHLDTLLRHVFLLQSINNMGNCVIGKDLMGYLTLTDLDTNIPLPINFPFAEKHGAHASKFKILS